MVVSVEQYAQAARISPRAARLRIENGHVDAQRVGRQWLIADYELARAHQDRQQPPGRPISAAAFERLAAFLDGDDAHLSAEHRRQASGYARRLLADDAARHLQLLARSRVGDPHAYIVAQDELADLRSEPCLVLSGVSAEGHSLSSARFVDAYVQRPEARRLVARYGLRPQDGPGGNVILRLVDHVPVRRGLRIAADLIDSHDARSIDEGVEIARRLAEGL